MRNLTLRRERKGLHPWDCNSMWDLDRGVYALVYALVYICLDNWVNLHVYMCYTLNAHMRVCVYMDGLYMYIYVFACSMPLGVYVLCLCVWIFVHAHKPWNSTLGMSSYDSYLSTRVLEMQR